MQLAVCEFARNILGWTGNVTVSCERLRVKSLIIGDNCSATMTLNECSCRLSPLSGASWCRLLIKYNPRYICHLHLFKLWFSFSANLHNHTEEKTTVTERPNVCVYIWTLRNQPHKNMMSTSFFSTVTK